MEFLTQLKKNLAESNRVYYYWDGIVFSADDFFSRLDKTYLYVVLPRGELLRIIGYVDFNQYKEMQVEYTSLPTYRIVTGSRKGRVIPAHRIMQDERFETAMINKHLEIGNLSTQLNPDNKHDMFMLQKLEGLSELINANTVEGNVSGLMAPKFYLCCKGPVEDLILHPRQNGTAFEYFKHFPEYQPALTLEQNCKAILKANVCYTDAGAGRKAFPFDVIYGKGVVATDMELFGKWRFTSSENSAIFSDHLKVCI